MTDAYIRRTAPAERSSTDWSQYSLDQIWEMVSTESGRVTYTQIGAWERMARLCREQADQLDSAKSQLLQRWPPRPGSASEAFSQLVNGLVTSMRQAAGASTANQEPLRNITSTLVTAQGDIAALLETRRRYALAEQQLTPQPTPSPGQTPLPPAPANLQRPPQDWRAQLDQQARMIMSHADYTVGAEAAGIQQPATYRLEPRVDDKTGSLGGASSGGMTGSDGAGFGQGSFIATGLAWSPGADGASHVDTSAVDVGGIATSTGWNATNLDPVLSGGPIGGPQAIDRPESLPGVAPSQRMVSGPGSSPNAPVGLVLGHDGLMSGRTSSTVPNSTRLPTSSGESGARGGTGAGVGGSGRTGSQVGMPMAPMVPPRGGQPGSGATSGMSSAGRLGRGVGRNHRARPDPDDPWAVAEGGPAVLEPPPEPTDHDPGPGVIGLER